MVIDFGKHINLISYLRRLNEGFATLFEYQIPGVLYPDWRMKDFFNMRALWSAFNSDARVNTRAMTKPLLTPAEISGSFDYVVYAKAGSVLRMFQYVVGEDIFKASLKLYLETKFVLQSFEYFYNIKNSNFF